MTSVRVLIVEDHPDNLDTFAKNVRRIDNVAEVDTASNKVEALERIRDKAYHVALIDINLTDFSGEGGDRSGIDVIKAINAHDEGTACIVLSAEKSAEVPVDAQDAGIAKYILKQRIRGPGDYVPVVEEAAANTVLRGTGRYADMVAYLARPEDRAVWEDQAIRMLQCRGSVGLFRVIEGAFGRFTPLLRRRDTLYSLIPNMTNHQMNGAFWSRALGGPIWVALGRKGVELDLPPADLRPLEVIHADAKGPENYSVWRLGQPLRREFYDSASEMK